MHLQLPGSVMSSVGQAKAALLYGQCCTEAGQFRAVQDRRHSEQGRERTGVQQRTSLSDPEYTRYTPRRPRTKGSNTVYVPEGMHSFGCLDERHSFSLP